MSAINKALQKAKGKGKRIVKKLDEIFIEPSRRVNKYNKSKDQEMKIRLENKVID